MSTPVLDPVPSSQEPAAAPVTAPSKYVALRTVAGIIRVLGFLIAIGAAIAAFVILVNSGRRRSVFGAEVVPGLLVFGAIASLSLIAYADLILLFIDVEENTRKTADALTKRSDQI